MLSISLGATAEGAGVSPPTAMVWNLQTVNGQRGG